MRDSHKCTRICPLCGRKITYTEWSEDGIDWMGHHRGHSDSGTIGYECECDKITFPQMCYNCKYYHNKGCVNEKVMKKYRDEISATMPFNVGNLTIELKHPERNCELWELEPNLMKKLFKKVSPKNESK